MNEYINTYIYIYYYIFIYELIYECIYEVYIIWHGTTPFMMARESARHGTFYGGTPGVGTARHGF